MRQPESKTTKESAYVAIRKGSAIIPLDFVEPARTVRVVSFLGTVLPPHCTAAGKVHLVFELDGAAGQNLPDRLERYTERTIVDRNVLREQMTMIGESGYAVERGEFAPEVNAVAVPIRDYTRTLVGTLVVVALAVDSAALPIGHAVDASTLLRRHHTIGTGTRLRTIDCPLALLKARGLAAGDLAVANAALDALLLVILALIDAPHRLGGRAAGGEQARRQNRVWDSSEFGHRSLDLDSTADVPS